MAVIGGLAVAVTGLPGRTAVYIFLKERFGARRVAAAVVIAAGIVLIST